MKEVTDKTVLETVEKVEAEESTESTKPTMNGTSENGVSSTSPEKKSPEKIDADVLLAQGKRHLFIKDFPTAVTMLGDACAKLAEMHGDLADDCAEAYFHYGRALLELAREESNVLGTEPEKGDSEGNDEEEGEDGEEDGKSVDEEAEAKEDKKSVDGEAEAKEDKKSVDGEAEAKEDNKEEISDKAEDGNSKNEAKEESVADETIDTTKEVNAAEEGDEEENEEDVDNLQLAWEIFELCKNIYERQKDDAKLAQTYLFLGEVGMESENYVSAVDDMKKCVEIQKKIFPPHHRDIAETYFQLGIACSLSNEFDEAIENFKTSCEILEARIKELEVHGAPEVDLEKDPFYSVEKEVSEIKALLPEIKTKISDMEDFKQETLKRVIEKLKENPQSSDGAGTSSSSSVPTTNGTTPKPVTDISHLVRKKRKPDEETASEQMLKKSCTEEVKK